MALSVTRSLSTALSNGRALFERERVLGPLLLTPAVLYIALLVGFPFLFALYLSLTDATTGNPYGRYIGLDNFVEVFQDPVAMRALRNTFTFTVLAQVAVLVLANILAHALQRPFRGRGLVMFLVLLPWVAPVSLTTIGWLWIFHARFSILDWMLRGLGWLGPGENMFWLGRPNLAMFSVVTVHVWRMLPFATVILLAGLAALPRDVLDQAEVDGAGFWRRLFHIVLPLMAPVTAVAVLFGTIFTFTDMAVVYVLTRGGPFDTTQVLSSLAFFKGIFGGNLSVGASISLLLFPVLLVAAVMVLRLARRVEVA
ncbi:MAG: sugar ABC transporter permease [Armatimonadota bacterium]|nr:sugar ABC transporter permease [Armatimonadota bacterium]MDR7450862.1 sugar ABC transporter permease [Armatimonadota bacterium]MDR7465783.1 sugar ABC transporter permease [Armatimonadota bacterium]MDR7493691.1 sugar ABC transporter permease [Armatimonadota bacterium]MDR7499060.1 sugar ABC transporter permease [Armatimonadota bacterium]